MPDAAAESPQCCLLLSDFNLGTFAGYLSNDLAFPTVRSVCADFGQVLGVLVDPVSPCYSPRPDSMVVWTQPQGAAPSFNLLLDNHPTPIKSLLSEVDVFADAVASAAPRVGCVFVPTWVLPPWQRGLGVLDLKNEAGLGRSLLQMNARLVDRLAGVANVYTIDTQRWTAAAGVGAFNAKLWHLTKVPLGNAVFKFAVADIKSALRALRGQARKLVVLDLDDTLWGGVVGDVGYEGLKLGGHDAIGEAFAEFQRALKALTRRGVVLGIVSKNDQSVALQAIRNHPEMVLREADFAGWRINWADKADNLGQLVQELNLGLQSVVFIDDNPVERARIREALPEVLVPEWPRDKMLYASTLRAMDCFDGPSVSEEDRRRAGMYASGRQREELRTAITSPDEFLRSLSTCVTVKPLNEADLARTAQLLNKTNQMNLSTRRMTEGELLDWTRRGVRGLWTLRVADRFGDSGLTGIVSIDVVGRGARLIDFILSCRVFGRRLENAMLSLAVEQARALSAETLEALYTPTKKNKPTLDFLAGSGMASDGEGRSFSWNLAEPYLWPQHIERR